MQSDFFKNNLFLGFLGQKGMTGAQNKVFQVLWKIDAWNFSDVAWSCNKSLKIDWNDWLRKNLVLKFLVQKGTKPMFFKFYEKLTLRTFSFFFFCMKLPKQNGVKLNQMISSVKILFWNFWAKSGQEWVFKSHLTNWCIEYFWVFCMKLEQHKNFILC